MMDRVSDKMLENMIEICVAFEHDFPWLSALQELKERRENQPKYEKALAKMTEYFRCSKLKGLYVSEKECHKYKSCSECMVDYFKKQVGLEVPS